MPFKDSLNTFLIDKWGQPITAAANFPQNAVKSLSEQKQIITKIIAEFKNQNRAEIKAWQNALKSARNPEDQRCFELQDLFDNLESDGHFISMRELRKSATLCADFSVIDKTTGDIDSERTEFFREEWFYDFREMLLDHIFKGFTLLELRNPRILEFREVPRRNVAPLLGRVYNEVGGTSFIDFNRPEFARQIIKIGKINNIGLMADLCGQLIWKRNAQQAWAEYAEKYGQPLITATTNKTAQNDLDQIKNMLFELGEAARAVLPEGTTIKIDPFTGGDSYKVYDSQIERINTEISKPMVGGTMITDDGSSRSQSEVHERNLDEKISARDRLIVEYITNGQLIPIMQMWGHDINPEIHRFRYDASFELTLKEHWQVISDALEHYDIPDDWVSKTFNFPITKRKEKQPGLIPGMKQTAQGKSPFTANFK